MKHIKILAPNIFSNTLAAYKKLLLEIWQLYHIHIHNPELFM